MNKPAAMMTVLCIATGVLTFCFLEWLYSINPAYTYIPVSIGSAYLIYRGIDLIDKKKHVDKNIKS